MLNIFDFIYYVGWYALSCWLCDVLGSPLRILYDELATAYGHNKIINLKSKYGNWAAITGATDGIGRAYAKELAKRGINVVLISRSEEKLRAVAREIEEEFYVNTKIIVADFSQATEIYASIETELDNVPVRIFVNNVGQTTALPGNIYAFKAKDLWNVINTNIVAVTQLSRYFMKRTLAAGDKAIIVNICSYSENNPMPFFATYAASKAYTRSLTLALQRETRNTNVDVQLVSPNLVATKMVASASWLMRGNFLIPDAEKFARCAVRRIGQVEETSGFFWHGVVKSFLQIFPMQFLTWILKKLTIVTIDKDKQSLMI